MPSNRPTLRWLAPAAILICASPYFFRLGAAPVSLGGDEAQFAIHAQSLASTGRDLNGQLLPVFVNITDPLAPSRRSGIWYQPLLFYLVAAAIKLRGVSEATVRLPVVLIAILDGVLMCAVARRVLEGFWWGVAASVILLLSPAHFLFGRQAVDYILPLPFVLGWLWSASAFFDTGKRRYLLTATLLLGLGMYSYVAAWATTSLLLVATLVVASRTNTEARDSIVLAVFTGLAPLLIAGAWLSVHSSALSDTAARYGVGGRVTASGLLDRASLYWEYFDPAYLFLAGGANPTQSTRHAGLLPLAMSPFLVAGLYDCWQRRSEGMRSLLLFGFAAAPVPIVAAMPQSAHYAAGRELVVVPFAVLIAVAGIARLRSQSSGPVRLAALLLVALVPIQFCSFLGDYLTTYQVSSAARFDPVNMRDVADFVMADHAAAAVPAVYLSDALDDGGARWKFYTLKAGREDVWQRTHLMNVGGSEQTAAPAGSVAVVDAGDTRWTGWAGGHWTIAKTVMNATGEACTLILRKDR
jgi:4-amino-4-deoxy-L-arabinose transferase-like glycosyltransferase